MHFGEFSSYQNIRKGVKRVKDGRRSGHLGVDLAAEVGLLARGGYCLLVKQGSLARARGFKALVRYSGRECLDGFLSTVHLFTNIRTSCLGRQGHRSMLPVDDARSALVLQK